MRDFNLTYIDILFLGVPESINLLHNNKAFERMSPFVIVILVMLTTKTLIVVHATIICPNPLSWFKELQDVQELT